MHAQLAGNIDTALVETVVEILAAYLGHIGHSSQLHSTPKTEC